MVGDLRKTVLLRYKLVAFAVTIVMLAAIGKAFKLKLVDGSRYGEQLKASADQSVTVEANRGDILASDGRKLACSVPSYRIFMDPCADGLEDDVFDASIDELSQKLSQFFGDKSAREYRSQIAHARIKGRRYMPIGNRRLTYTELKQVREFPIFNRGANKGGFRPESDDYRRQPFGLLASRTIGKLYNDKRKGGVIGLEHAYNDELRGHDGVSKKVRITGKWLDKEVIPPEDGRSIVSTIDIDIQDVAEHSLMKQLIRHNADHGVVVVMEVKTGAVRAIVNLHRQADGKYVEDYYNYAIGELAEPGSTFKLATVMACLEDGVIELDDTVNTFAGSYKIYDRVMRDSKKGGHGTVTVREAFEVSSNIAFSRIVQKCYGSDPQRFVDALADLGLRDSLGIDLTGEGRTHIKNSNDPTWSGTTLPWMSIGYELQITPLHLLTFYNAVANNGTMMRPMFVEGIVEHGEMVERKKPTVLRSSICSGSTIRKARSLLKGVVDNGTARNISDTPYGIAGKTGTAQIAHGASGYSNYGSVSYLASFAGYFPADKPQYSCIVMVYGPSNNVYYGNVVAGSVFRNIADRIYAAGFRYGRETTVMPASLSAVMPYSKGGRTRYIRTVLDGLDMAYSLKSRSAEWVSARAGADEVTLTGKHFVDNMVPDVRGLGASDAVGLLEEHGLQVSLIGLGRVVWQSIPAGTRYTKGTVIKLQLNND